MDWFDCPICIYRHPFHVPERACPNLSLSEERCKQIFNKSLKDVLRNCPQVSSKCPPEDKCPPPDPPLEDIPIPAGKPAIVKDAAYWREMSGRSERRHDYVRSYADCAAHAHSDAGDHTHRADRVTVRFTICGGLPSAVK
jgi:hypothetical protein